MSPPKVKPRISILKKRPSELMSQSPEPTSTLNDKARKGVLFTNKHTVKEFIQMEEKVVTIWGNSYETSIGGRSEGSSDDGTHTFKKLRMDFSCSSMQTTSDASSFAEIDKENYTMPVPQVDDDHRNFLAPRAASAERQKVSMDSLNNFEISSANSTNNSASLDNLTVQMNPGEKKRVTKYGTGSLNITTHIADMDISLPNADEQMVLSPRKTMFNHPQFSIGLKEKVLVKRSEATKENVFIECSDTTVEFESDEDSLLKAQLSRAQEKGPSSSRQTVFGSLMEQTLKPPAHSPIRIIPKARSEIHETLVTRDRQDSFFDLEIEETLAHPKPTQEASFDLEVEEVPQSKYKNPPFVLHVDECDNVSGEMEITLPGVVEQTLPPHSDSRKTVFHSEMDETIVVNKPKDVREACHELHIEEREPTTSQEPTFVDAADESYASSPMDITLAGSSDRIVPPSRKTSRQTFYNSEIDETLVKKDRRETRFDIIEDEEPSSQPEEIEETRLHSMPHSSFLDLDGTIFANQSMTLVELPSTSKPPLTSRDTIFNADVSYTCSSADLEKLRKEALMMNCTKISDCGILETTSELAEKAARLLRDPMATGSTGNLFEKSMQDGNSLSEVAGPLRRMPSEMYERATITEHQSIISSDAPRKSTSFNDSQRRPFIAPPFSIGNESQQLLDETAGELSTIEMNKNASNIVAPFIAPPFSIGNDSQQLLDETVGEIDIEVSEDNENLASCIAPWKQTKFSIYNDSEQLMNVTAAELNNMLEDTSNPCVSDVNETDNTLVNNTIHLSFGENTSLYQNALQDFVNITIANSPLSMSAISSRPTGGPTKIKPVELDTPVDYGAKMEGFITTLKKKEVEPPRMDIDKFLEKLNINPVQIKMPEQFKPDYLEKRIAALKEKLAREAQERKVQEEALKKLQQPETPSLSFLIRNKIACLEEELRKEFKKNQLAVPPIFPENRDFDFLFRNKFETDLHLSKYWLLDLNVTWLNQFKIYHKKMPALIINFSVRNPNKDLDNSTLPVYFDKVFMYNNYFYRGTLGRRLKLHKSELKHALGTDIFSDICTSMNDLPSFLEHYHSHVMKSVALVDNFIDIIVKNGAIIEAESDSTYIVKRHFFEDKLDYVDVKILLYHYIEDISINEVSVTSSTTEYFYEMEPRQGISKLRGLMLIETVLFNAEKLVSENSRRVQVP